MSHGHGVDNFSHPSFGNSEQIDLRKSRSPTRFSSGICSPLLIDFGHMYTHTFGPRLLILFQCDGDGDNDGGSDGDSHRPEVGALRQVGWLRQSFHIGLKLSSLAAQSFSRKKAIHPKMLTQAGSQFGSQACSQ